MLEPLKAVLAKKEILLASSSPRRKQILENAGLKFKIEVSKFEEDLDKKSFRRVTDYVLETARQKALEVKNRVVANGEYPDLIIGADTIVTLDDEIYEKPKDKSHAVQILTCFSGRRHTVYSALCLLWRKANEDYVETSFVEGTDVEFSALSAEVIKVYVETGEPMDKAGGYAIQGLGGSLVVGIQGDYYNVMGFPLHAFCKELTRLLAEVD